MTGRQTDRPGYVTISNTEYQISGICEQCIYRRLSHNTTALSGREGGLVGLPPGGVRVFGQFAWLEFGFVKEMLSRPAPPG